MQTQPTEFGSLFTLKSYILFLPAKCRLTLFYSLLLHPSAVRTSLSFTTCDVFSVLGNSQLSQLTYFLSSETLSPRVGPSTTDLGLQHSFSSRSTAKGDYLL